MPPTVKDAFNKLKVAIVGTKTSEIDTKLDDASKDIVLYRSQINRNNAIEIVKSLIAKNGYNLPSTFGSSSTSISPASLGQGGRTQRYKMYESITSNIPYCNRALQVLVDNILSPDDITKVALDIKPNTFLEDDANFESNSRNIRELIDKIKIEKYLDLIVKNTLHMGDFFCEVADDKTALTSKAAILSESSSYLHIKPENKDTVTVKLEEKKNLEIILDYSSFQDLQNPKGKIKADNLHMLFYDPRRVVKLQSNMFPICFGYLVFPISAIFPHMMMQDQVVNTICNGILSSLEKKIPSIKPDNINMDDLRDILRTMIRESDPTRSMNIRYVPPDKMQHFCIPTTKYYPYGESIFDSTQFTAKVVMALETALTIHRLNRSIEKRKINVEIGLPRDARKAIEKLKEEFRKRKISIDSFGSVDTIPSMVTSFEDVYIPQKDGKPFVDISTFNDAGSDTRGKVDEIKAMRDQCVASVGVPPSYIGIEENLSNKCLDPETEISLLNRQSIKLSSLVKEYEENGMIFDKWTYSYDKNSGKIVPGKITWAGITRKNAQVIKITFDNGKNIIVTPDHKIMLRNGEYIEAKDLNSGDSVMPLYRKLTKSITCTTKMPYEEVYHPGIEKWEMTHRAVAINEGIVSFKDGLVEKSLKARGYLNHKVVSIEYLEERIDTCDITVDVYHNFATEAGVIVSNSALGEESLLFARTIVGHQKYLSQQIQELILKFYQIIDPDKALNIFDDVIVAFSIPRSLQYERESKYLSDLAALVQTLETIGIPREWAKKKYLTSIDWDEVKKHEIDAKIDQNLKLPAPDELASMAAGLGGMGGDMSGMGGMGGLGGMGGGMPPI